MIIPLDIHKLTLVEGIGAAEADEDGLVRMMLAGMVMIEDDCIDCTSSEHSMAFLSILAASICLLR